MFELGPGPQHPSEQLAVLEKGAGLRSHTFPPVLSTVGPEPPNPRAGRGTPGHPREGCGLGLAPWGCRSRRPFPRVFLRRISEGRAPLGGGHADRGPPPGHFSGSPPPGPGRGLREARRQPADGDRRLLRGLPARPLRSPLPPPRGRARRGQRARPSVCPSVCPSPPRRGVPPAGGPGGVGAPGPGTPCPGARTSAGPTGREGLSRADSYSGRPRVLSRGEDGPKDMGRDVSCSV